MLKRIKTWFRSVRKAMPTLLRSALGVLVAALGGGLSIYIVTTNSCNKAIVQPPANTPEPGDPWETTRCSGDDERGRRANFFVSVLTQEHRWKFGDTEHLESGLIGEILPRYLKLLAELNEAKEIIAVGTASQEGGLPDEEARADRRADEIIKVVRPLSELKNLYKLNLGQHMSSGNGDTSYQRRVIIVGIMSRDPEMALEDIRRALYNALSQENKFPFETLRYSAFILYEV